MTTPSKPTSRIQRVLWTTVSATAFGSIAGIVWFWLSGEEPRVRETGYFVLDQFFFLERINPYRQLPVFLSEYHTLNSIPDVLGLGAGILVASLPLNLAAVLAAIGLAAILPRRLRSWIDDRIRAVVFAVIFSPIVYLVVARQLTHWTRDLTARATGGVIATMVALALFAYLARRPRKEPDPPLSRWIIRSGIGLAPLLLLGWSADRWTPYPPHEPAAPNVLLISIDSLRADHLSSYGYERNTSPRIDALAAQGVRFETAVAPTSWTLPSHMSLLTGLDTLGHGVRDTNHRLHSSVPTLAEMMRAQGYETAGVVGGVFLNARWGFSRGFNFYDDFSVGRRGSGADHYEITSPRTTATAGRWLEDWSGRRERPFFLFVHLWDVHYNFNPPPPYDVAFDVGYTGPEIGNFESNKKINPDMDPVALEHIKSQYDGEILYTDSYVGKLLDLLDSLDLQDNTAVILTADHGEEFFEHGRKGHRTTLYEEVVRVPLIMRLPGQVPSGLVVRQPVRLIDVAPTILRLAGGDWEAAVPPVDPLYDGRDLMPLTNGTASDELPRLAFLDVYHINFGFRAVRSPGQKFILSREGEAELYNLEADPGELTNLAAESIDISAGYRGLLRDWKARRASVEVDNTQPSQEQLEVLRGLGYIQ